jgi:hypothetical protein
MNCHGCGVELDPSQAQVNKSRSTLPLTRFWRPFLETIPKDAEKKGGVCPLLRPSKVVLTRIAGPSYLACCWPVCSLASTWGSEFRDRDGPTVQHWQGRRWHGRAPTRRLSGSSGSRSLSNPVQTTRSRMERSAFDDSRAGSQGWGDGTRGRRQGRALGLSRHSRRVLVRCGGYALLNASNIPMLTGECRSY